METHLCKLRGILRSCMKQNKDTVWYLVLLLVTGVRAEPKYSYSYDIISYVPGINMCVRIVTFDFSLKYVLFFLESVPGSRYFSFFFQYQAVQHMPVGHYSIPSENVKRVVCGLSRSG